MHRTFKEIMDTALKNSLEYMPAYIAERNEASKLKKYPYKNKLKSRKKKE